MTVKRGYDRIGAATEGTTKFVLDHFVVAGGREKEFKTIEAEVLEQDRRIVGVRGAKECNTQLALSILGGTSAENRWWEW